MGDQIVFVSYPSEDVAVAQTVYDAIQKIPGLGLQPFLDRVYIKGGADIPTEIEDALKQTIYFVGIGTDAVRRNFDWCGRELGFYQAAHPAGRRITCLYSGTIPEAFVLRENYKAQALDELQADEFGYPICKIESSQFYSFLSDLADVNAKIKPPTDQKKYWSEVGAWATAWAKSLTDSFFEVLQNRVKNDWYPQGRIEIVVENGNFFRDAGPVIPHDSNVILSNTTYTIFDAAIPSIIREQSWKSFTEYVKTRSGGDVFSNIITDICVSALPDRVQAKNDYVFQAPNQIFYRILLIKHSVYGNNKRVFVFNLVQTLEKVQGGDPKTTALVAGIALGSKYRSLFFEPSAKYKMASLQAMSSDPDKLAGMVNEMLHDIDRISADAASDGLADYSALQKLLGNTDEIKRLFDRWWQIFPSMETAAKKFIESKSGSDRDIFYDEYAKFLDMSRDNNVKFINLCIDEYRKTL